MTLDQLARLYPYFTLVIVLAALLQFNRIKRTIIATLPVYLIVITLLNLYAERRLQNGHNTTSLFNLLVIPLEFFYFYALLFLFAKRKKIKIFMLLLSAMYVLVFLADLLLFKNEYAYLYRRSYTTGALALFVMALLYYYELLNSERIIRFYREPGFWISTGLLVFYLGTLPFHIAWNYTADSFLKAFYTNKYNFYILMYLMYTCFLTSIICLRWKGK